MIKWLLYILTAIQCVAQSSVGPIFTPGFIRKPPAGASSTLNTGLIAYWKLDESSDGSGPVTRNDSYSTNHLSDNNTTASATGKISNGADIETGNSEYLSIADNAALSTGNIDFTWALWCKLESVVSFPVLGKWKNTGNQREYQIYHDNTTHYFQFIVSSNGAATSVLGSTNSGSISSATWYFVVGWHDSVNNQLGISVNNGTPDYLPYSTGGFDSTAALYIGSREAGGYFDGIIDEVGFWKKVLTAAEITELYNAGTGKTYPF